QGRRRSDLRLEEGQRREVGRLVRAAGLRCSPDRAERDQARLRQGHGTATRQAVFQNMKKVSIKNWILGGSFKWSTKSNDPLNAKFYIFQIQSNGSYKLVG